jgi:hypothetical protein
MNLKSVFLGYFTIAIKMYNDATTQKYIQVYFPHIATATERIRCWWFALQQTG